jgi:hypothetical protein
VATDAAQTVGIAGRNWLAVLTAGLLERDGCSVTAVSRQPAASAKTAEQELLPPDAVSCLLPSLRQLAGQPAAVVSGLVIRSQNGEIMRRAEFAGQAPGPSRSGALVPGTWSAC